MQGGSKIVTRGALMSDNDASADDTVPQPATLQSVDDKLNAIMKLLQSITNDIREMKTEQRELGTSIELCHSNIVTQDTNIYECNNEVQRLSNENDHLRSKVNSLATEIRALEQYSHRNNLVIYDFLTGQPTSWMLCTMGKENNDGPRPIVVKFVSRLDRDEFLRKRKVRRQLKDTDLGFSSENSVYINESLTSSTRDLLKLIKIEAKEKNFTQVWTSICSIFVRKEKEKGEFIKILSVNDQDKM
ncbi:hypothetical protein J6590_058551 [Homalodisca vitripennis]|nr:hypothetical protein J6590_058551 [Homalodisca vitripennis]